MSAQTHDRGHDDRRYAQIEKILTVCACMCVLLVWFCRAMSRGGRA